MGNDHKLNYCLSYTKTSFLFIYYLNLLLKSLHCTWRFTLIANEKRFMHIRLCYSIQSSSLTHCVNSNIFKSRGSPFNWPCMLVREWQDARACMSGLVTGRLLTSTTHSPNFSPERTGITEWKSNPSSVRVPV